MDTARLQQLILENTFTVSALEARLGVVRLAVEQVVYESSEVPLSERWREALLDLSSPATAGVVAWGTDWLAAADSQALAGVPGTLATWLDTLPTFTVYVPVTFTNEAAKPLATWARAQLAPTTILSLQVDEDVVGGCGFIYNNEYYERALISRGQELLAAVITEVVASYVE